MIVSGILIAIAVVWFLLAGAGGRRRSNPAGKCERMTDTLKTRGVQGFPHVPPVRGVLRVSQDDSDRRRCLTSSSADLHLHSGGELERHAGARHLPGSHRAGMGSSSAWMASDRRASSTGGRANSDAPHLPRARGASSPSDDAASSRQPGSPPSRCTRLRRLVQLSLPARQLRIYRRQRPEIRREESLVDGGRPRTVSRLDVELHDLPARVRLLPLRERSRDGEGSR